MRSALFRRRFELFGLLVALAFGALHGCTSRPLVGLSKEGGPLHRGVQAFEARVTNVQFRLRGERPASRDLVVVELDEAGAQRYGLWPWPRAVVAKLIRGLLEGGAKVVGLDIAFTDEAPGDAAAKAVLAKLQAAGPLTPELEALKAELAQAEARSPDAELEAALKAGGPRVVQGVLPLADGDTRAIPAAVLARYREGEAAALIREIPGEVKGSVVPLTPAQVEGWRIAGVQTPLPRFASLGNRLGHFGTVTDVDGTIRRAALLATLGDRGFFPSLGLQVAAAALDATIEPMVDIDTRQLTGVRLRRATGEKVVVPVQGDLPFTPINYPGPEASFERLSAVDVLDGEVDPARLAGKAVLVGVTIMGSSGDQRVTPFNEFSPGIYTHASFLSNVLLGDFLRRPAVMTELEVLLFGLLALLLSALVPRLGAFTAKAGLIAAVVLSWSAFTVIAFGQGLQVSWVVPTAALLVAAFGTVFLGYLSVDREKLKLRSTFSRYLGEDVIALALENPERLNQGEKREMTVLFSDIRGFTSLSERLSPEVLAAFINEYLSPMTRIVFEEKGTLDKYIGDAVMAFWNAPLDQPDHALRACRAALAMLARLDELKAGWKAKGYPELEIGIGVNSGPMVVGNMGSDVRVDYTVLGDAVNLGSRLEGTTKEYDVRVIISESTWAQAKDQVVARRLGAVRVKGKRQPVRIFELRGLGAAKGAEAEAIAAFEGAVDAWNERRFDDAAAGFRRVLEAWPGDPPSRRYLAAIDALAGQPADPDWDGVVSLKTK
ncbi:MAG: adenylate/guanylate cyclase domain-containing protein [Myxococcota bacterium]